jgi:FtsP/CotA-like multicopper oxidase with cupredoxin domain
VEISNQANDKAHPFHIHINPFQITEVFEPNAPDTNTLYPDKPCYLDPMNPGHVEAVHADPGALRLVGYLRHTYAQEL